MVNYSRRYDVSSVVQVLLDGETDSIAVARSRYLAQLLHSSSFVADVCLDMSVLKVSTVRYTKDILAEADIDGVEIAQVFEISTAFEYCVLEVMHNASECGAVD